MMRPQRQKDTAMKQNKPNRIRQSIKDNSKPIKQAATLFAGIFVATIVVLKTADAIEDAKELKKNSEESKRILTEMWNTHPAVIAANAE